MIHPVSRASWSDYVASQRQRHHRRRVMSAIFYSGILLVIGIATVIVQQPIPELPTPCSRTSPQ